MWDAIGTGAQLPAWSDGCLSLVLSCARAGAAAGVPSRVELSEVCSLPFPSQWTVGLAPLSRGVQGLVLQLFWEVGVGHSPLHGAHRGQLVFFLLQRTDINNPAEIPVCCTPARLCLCSTAGEVTGCAAHRCHLDCPAQDRQFHVQGLPKPQLLGWRYYQPPPPYQ